MSRPYLELPGLLGQIADALGVDVALRFAYAFGGTRLYVPTTPRGLNKDHPFVLAVGYAAAVTLIERILCPGSFMEVPLGRFNQLIQRRDTIRAMSLEGRSADEIAIALRITCRTVYRVRRKLQDEGRLPPSLPLQRQPRGRAARYDSLRKHAA